MNSLSSNNLRKRDDEKGQVTNFASVLEDSTDERQEEALLRMESEVQLLASLSEQAKEPLLKLLDRFSQAFRAAKVARMPDETSPQLMWSAGQFSVIDDLLDYARIEANAIEMRDEVVDLTTMVDSVIGLFGRQAAEKGLTFVAIIQPEAARKVMGDAGRIRQVLVNLVGNALRQTMRGSVVIRVESNEQWLRFEVNDTGQGLTKAECAKVFEPFPQLSASDCWSHGGTGLSLAICRSLVGRMQGSIDVTSRRGEGCQFWFRLPLRPVPDAKEIPIERPQQATVAWVADPSPEVIEAVQCVCQRCGMDVRSFSDVQTLLRALKDDTRACDLLFIDGGLISPSSAQSLATVWGARQKRDSRVVVTHDPSDSLKFKVAGWQFISRPWRLSTLIEICREADGCAPTKVVDKPAPLKLRVLVAEDNEINAMVLMTALSWLGCQSTLAANGEKAVELFRKEKFDAILMDCQMPVMDGYEATRQIRQFESERMGGKPVRIVAITGNSFNENRQRFLLAGIDDYLPKPFSLDRLRTFLQPDWSAESTQPRPATPTLLSGEFEELIRMVGPSDTAILGSRWIHGASECLQAIRVALSSADWPRIAKEAHAIAGTSALFGLVEVVRAAKLIEHEVVDTDCLSAASLEFFAGTIEQGRQALKLRLKQLERSNQKEHSSGATSEQCADGNGQ